MLTDLDHLALVLADAAGQLDALARRLTLLATDPRLLGSAVLTPLTAARLEIAVARAAYGPTGVATCSVGVGALANAVLAAVALYRGADTLVAGLLRRLEVSAGMVAGRLLGPALLAGGAAAVAADQPGSSDGTRDDGTQRSPGLFGWAAAILLERIGSVPGRGDRVLAAAPGLVAGALSPLGAAGLLGPTAVGGQRSTLRAAGAVTAATPWLHDSGRVRVTMAAPRPVRPPSGAGELVARTAQLSARAGARPGTVRVDRVRGADGARAWVVHIPGTQSWQARPGANPFDLSADAAALAGRPNAVGAVVARGLRSCGARPGEPVLLSGHSLGGIAAAELAADQVLRREFTITHVVSAGSPTALSAVPDDVSVLSLEHDQDPVPWLDGEPSPDRANWVTVRRPVGGALHAHDTQEYARTGAMVDASADGSLERWRAGLDRFLDRPGATATSWEVTGQRLP